MALTRVAAAGINTGGTFVLENVNTSGIVTAGTVQVGSATTIHSGGIDLGGGNITSHNINSTGIITATGGFVGAVTGNVTGDLTGDVTGDLTGNVSSSGANTLGSLAVTNDATVGGALTITGNLTVNGTTTTIDTAVTAVDSLAIDGNAIIDGSVGIGTDNPLSILDVRSSASDSGIYLGRPGLSPNFFVYNNGGQNSSRMILRHEGSNVIEFRADGAGSYINTGNIGIGTDTPGTKLDILNGSDAAVIATINGADTSSEYLGLGVSGTSALITAGGNGSTSTSLVFRTANSGTESERLYITSGGSILHLGNGTTSNPAITLSGTAPSDTLVTTSTGKIGIGTDNPSSKVTVAADSATSQLELKRTNANTTGAIGALNFTALDGHSVANIYAIGDGDDEGAHLAFRTTSAAGESDPYGSNTFERLRIDSGGKIASTYDGTPSVAQYGQLEVTKNGASDVDPNWSYLSFHRAGQIAWQQGIKDNHFVIAHTGGAARDTLDNERLRITSSGNVGIGLTNPSAKLHVGNNGSTQVIISNSSSSMSDGDTIGVLDFAAGPNYTVNARVAGHVEGTDELGGDLVFETRPDGGSLSERLRIASSGQLTLNLPTNTTSRHIGIVNSSGTIGWTFGNGITASARQFILYDNEAGAARVRVESNGFISNGNFAGQTPLDIVGSASSSILARPNTSSTGTYGDASAVNNLIHLRMPYGSNPGAANNNGARWGIKFTGRNDGAGYGNDDGKSASIYAVSEEIGSGYNRKVGLAFYTSPFDANQTEKVRITSDGELLLGGMTSPLLSSDDLQIQGSGGPAIISGYKSDNNPAADQKMLTLRGYSQSGSTFTSIGEIDVRVDQVSNTASGHHPGSIVTRVNGGSETGTHATVAYSFAGVKDRERITHRSKRFYCLPEWQSGNETNNSFRQQWDYQHYVGYNQYSWYKYSTHASSSSRGGSADILVTWHTRHAAGSGHGRYAVYWRDRHDNSKVEIMKFYSYFENYANGSFYGWTSNPSLDVYQCDGTGNSAGFYLRLQGHINTNSGTYDGGAMQQFTINSHTNRYGADVEKFAFVGNSTPSDVGAQLTKSNLP